MARAARRSVGSTLSPPTQSTERLSSPSSASSSSSSPSLSSTTEDPSQTYGSIYSTQTIPEFDHTTPTLSATFSPTKFNNVHSGGRDKTVEEVNHTAIAITRERTRMEFYATYDVMTGVRIAATLGGFFGLMVFLVIYKSRSHSSSSLKAMKKNPTLAAQAAIVMQVEEQRELEEAWQATSGFFLSEENSYPTNMGFKRQRMLSLGNISAPPALHRGFRFSSFGGGYSSLMDPPRRFSYSGARRKSTSESSRILSAYPMGDSFGTDDYLGESDDEEDEDEFDQGTTTADIGYQHYLCVPPKGRDSRRSSDLTCCSTESSYLERRCSTITIGLTPLPPISSRNPSRRTSKDAYDYYPNIQVIHPTPKSSPCPSEGNIFEKTGNGRNVKRYEPDSFDYISEYPDEKSDDYKIKKQQQLQQHQQQQQQQHSQLQQQKQDQSNKIDDSSVNTSTRRAPLASLSSFKISSADYQDSDLRSLGSDSVFAESYADTDEDMAQFSTDSDEISEPLQCHSLSKPTINSQSNDITNLEQKNYTVNPNTTTKYKLKSNSVNLVNTFETKVIIENKQQNDKQIMKRPASYSGCTTNFNINNNNDNNNSDDNTKSSECVDIDVRLVENRSTISPSVILELPVIATQDDTNSLDPSIPGTSRKWSKETLF